MSEDCLQPSFGLVEEHHLVPCSFCYSLVKQLIQRFQPDHEHSGLARGTHQSEIEKQPTESLRTKHQK